MSRLELALVRFPDVSAATSAFIAARDRCGPDTPWIRQSGLVEHHHNGHWVLRGNFAGHYVDVDEALHYSALGTVEGTLVGGVVGALLGPPGFAAGLVLGAMVGSQTGEPSERELQPEGLARELRNDLPGTGSAIALIAPADTVDEMLNALGETGGETVRHPLTAGQVTALDLSLSEIPPASGGPSVEGEEASEEHQADAESDGDDRHERWPERRYPGD